MTNGKLSWPNFPRKVIRLFAKIGISLLSVAYRVFYQMLLTRIQEDVQKRLQQEEAGYRRGRRTTEQIFILRNILEQSAEWQTPLHIDFTEAFDSVRSTGTFLGTMALLTTSSTPYKSFDGSTCCVVQNSRASDHSTVETGIKQGCVMSGFLFNIIVK